MVGNGQLRVKLVTLLGGMGGVWIVHSIFAEVSLLLRFILGSIGNAGVGYVEGRGLWGISGFRLTLDFQFQI